MLGHVRGRKGKRPRGKQQASNLGEVSKCSVARSESILHLMCVAKSQLPNEVCIKENKELRSRIIYKASTRPIRRYNSGERKV